VGYAESQGVSSGETRTVNTGQTEPQVNEKKTPEDESLGSDEWRGEERMGGKPLSVGRNFRGFEGPVWVFKVVAADLERNRRRMEGHNVRKSTEIPYLTPGTGRVEAARGATGYGFENPGDTNLVRHPAIRDARRPQIGAGRKGKRIGRGVLQQTDQEQASGRVDPYFEQKS